MKLANAYNQTMVLSGDLPRELLDVYNNLWAANESDLFTDKRVAIDLACQDLLDIMQKAQWAE